MYNTILSHNSKNYVKKSISLLSFASLLLFNGCNSDYVEGESGDEVTTITEMIVDLTGGGGSNDVNFLSPDTADDTVTGSVGKGKAVKASVSIYKNDNTLLGTDNNLIDGIYSIPLGGYTGKVRVIANITEYIDEKLNKSMTLANLELSAISSITSDNRVVNVTPLTEVSSRILGIGALLNANVSNQEIADMNIYVAKASGITDNYNPAKDQVVYLNKDAGEQADTALNRNAIVLLSISNKSNLQEVDSNIDVLNKTNIAINKFYSAFLKSSSNNDGTC